MDDLHHLSLCTGLAGIDLGLRRVLPRLRTVAYVEREAFAAANVVAKMEAGELDAAPVYPDLCRFPFAKYRGLVDIVSSGFPCQPFSYTGIRKGVRDERHLWPFIRSGIEELQPSACFFENVEGIVTAPSTGYHAVLHHVLCDLEQLGFRATAGCFTSREVGAPHRRRRWFILGLADSYRGGGGEDQLHCELRTTGAVESPCDSGGTWPGEEGEVTGWPVGPDARQHVWEESRTIEPSVGGTTDGVPNRVDRLRALGNACVPDQVSNAYAELWSVLNDER